jgi:acylpyruvate hydrolase
VKLISFADQGTGRLGVVSDGAIIDIEYCAPEMPRELRALLEAGPRALTRLQAIAGSAPKSAHHQLSDVKIGLPIANPGKIICLGLSYADHAAEGGHTRPEYPSLFLRATSSLVAHGDPIIRPRCSEKLDYEAELTAVIGRTARHVSRANALDYVAGYTCFNDATIRDYQGKTAQWTIGKNFDTTGALGPVFVTADELPPGAEALRICSRLNGRVMQDANHPGHAFPRGRNDRPPHGMHDT